MRYGGPIRAFCVKMYRDNDVVNHLWSLRSDDRATDDFVSIGISNQLDESVGFSPNDRFAMIIKRVGSISNLSAIGPSFALGEPNIGKLRMREYREKPEAVINTI